jgi:hypothetical protein
MHGMNCLVNINSTHANSLSSIQTYGNRATMRRGCNPKEHAIAYMDGEEPSLLTGEQPLTKAPIAIVPSTPNSVSLSRASRIRFGRGYALQNNIKAKDIGHVRADHIGRLVSYWRMEMGMDIITSNVGVPELAAGPGHAESLETLLKHEERCA